MGKRGREKAQCFRALLVDSTVALFLRTSNVAYMVLVLDHNIHPQFKIPRRAADKRTPPPLPSQKHGLCND